MNVRFVVPRVKRLWLFENSESQKKEEARSDKMKQQKTVGASPLTASLRT